MKKLFILVALGVLGACTYHTPEQVVYFETAKYNVSPKDKKALITYFNQNYQDKHKDGYMVHLYGHTDYVGNAEYNKKLSEKRVNAVKQVFLDAGVQPWRIRTETYGYEKPIDNNKTVKGRANNRRVVISYLPVTPGDSQYNDQIKEKKNLEKQQAKKTKKK